MTMVNGDWTITKQTGVSVAVVLGVAALSSASAAWASNQMGAIRQEMQSQYVTKDVFDRELKHISSSLIRIEEKIGESDQ